MLGPLLAFFSAACFGLNNATVRRGVIGATVLQGMAVTVPAGIPIFAIFTAFLGGYVAMMQWSMSSWLWMMGAGVVHFVIGRFGNYRATQALGSALSAPLQQLSIVVSLIAAGLFLNESLNIVNLFGIAIVVLGPVIVMQKPKKPSKNGFQPDFAAGSFWGLVCALGYGISPLMIVLGLGEARSMADSAAGVLVSYIAAAIVVAVMVVMQGGRRYLNSMGRASLGWFMISALFVALSQLFRYLALALAPVSVVVPIQRLSAIFRVLFSAILNKDHEVITMPLVIVIFLSVFGSAILTLDTRTLLGFLSLKPDLVEWLSHPLY
jgi:Predicted membrane protein